MTRYYVAPDEDDELHLQPEDGSMPPGPFLCGTSDPERGQVAADQVWDSGLRGFMANDSTERDGPSTDGLFTFYDHCPVCAAVIKSRHNYPDERIHDTLAHKIDRVVAADQPPIVQYELSGGVEVDADDADDLTARLREITRRLTQLGYDLDGMVVRTDRDIIESIGYRMTMAGVGESPTSIGYTDPEADPADVEIPEDYDIDTFDVSLEVSEASAIEAAREQARQESGLRTVEGGVRSAKHRDPEEWDDVGTVAGKWPGVAGVTKDGICVCLDCAIKRDLVDFNAEPTRDAVEPILRDSEWDYVPTCSGCDAALDVRVLEDSTPEAEEADDEADGLGALFE